MPDDVIKWKHFPRYWPFVRGIHRSPVNSPHKVQWRGALKFSLICARINGWVNNREAGDLRRHRAHYDVTVMILLGFVSLWLYGWWIHGTCSPMVFNSLVTGKCSWNPSLVFLNVYQDDGLEHFLCNYPQVNALRLYLWQVNINSNNGLVLSGNKPLTEPVLTKTPLARPLWVQVVSLNNYPSAIYVTLRDIGKFDPYQATTKYNKAQSALQWRHNGRDSVWNHQPHDCLLNCLFRRRSKKTSKLRVTGLCVGNSPGTGEFPAQMASNAENVSIWWRHHGIHVPWDESTIIIHWWKWNADLWQE